MGALADEAGDELPTLSLDIQVRGLSQHRHKEHSVHDALLPLGGPRGLVYVVVSSSSRCYQMYPLPW